MESNEKVNMGIRDWYLWRYCYKKHPGNEVSCVFKHDISNWARPIIKPGIILMGAKLTL